MAPLAGVLRTVMVRMKETLHGRAVGALLLEEAIRTYIERGAMVTVVVAQVLIGICGGQAPSPVLKRIRVTGC